PSFYDGMPNVMLEAGALGIPIIASNVDGMADVIEHEKEGLLFRAGDEDDCRKVLYQLVELGEEIKALGEALKRKITNQYTKDHEIEAYTKHIV
ncbi:MAG: glycosyltransferase, partial [Bacteroidota bacterium]